MDAVVECGLGRYSKIPQICWQASLATSASFRFPERYNIKKYNSQGRYLMLVSVLLMHAHIRVYKCTLIKIINNNINNKINISQNFHNDNIIIMIVGVNIKSKLLYG